MRGRPAVPGGTAGRPLVQPTPARTDCPGPTENEKAVELAPVPRPRPLLTTGRLVVLGATLGTLVVLALLPTVLGLQRHLVADDSMAGAFGRGSVLLAREVPVSALEVGDVLVTRPPGAAADSRPIGHRIVELGLDSARTRGDANVGADPWVVPLDGATASRMVLAVPYVGHPFLSAGHLLAWGAAGGLVLSAAGLSRRPRRDRRGPAALRRTTPAGRARA